MPEAREVRLRESALEDLKAIYTYLAERIGHDRADAYTSRIEAFCRSLSIFSERGRRRDDLLEGLRVVTFESRAIIAYRLVAEQVVIVRVIHGGQDYDEDTFR